MLLHADGRLMLVAIEVAIDVAIDATPYSEKF